MCLCVAGAYLESHSVFAVGVMFGFAVLGYVMHRFDYSRVTFLVGFVVGPLFELSLRQSIIITQGSPAALLHHPAALLLMLVSLVAAVLFVRGSMNR